MKTSRSNEGFSWCLGVAVLAALLLPLQCEAVAELPKHWVACVPAMAMPPYLSNDAARPGVVERLLMAAGKEVGVDVEVQYLPLPRCMAMLERGQVDAAIGAPSHSVAKFAKFPVKDSKPHPAQSIARIKVVLVARADAREPWSPPTTRRAKGPAPVVAVRRKASTVIEPLTSFGFQVDESTLSLASALGMLRLGRVDYVAAMEDELVELEKTFNMDGLRIERPPVLQLDYYAGVSLARWASDKEVVERWWLTMARLRHTAAFAVR